MARHRQDDFEIILHEGSDEDRHAEDFPRREVGRDVPKAAGGRRDSEAEPGVRYGPKIFMPPDVRDYIHEYAASDTSRELGGILVGRVFQTDDVRPENTVISIEGLIPAKFAESASTTIKFTHETWAYVNQIKDEKYPHLKIVGWVHTHPGFGIFLSGYDQFIQNNFFNAPFQVAYVVDPVNNEAGFFINGKRGPEPASDMGLLTVARPERRPRKPIRNPAPDSGPPVSLARPGEASAASAAASGAGAAATSGTQAALGAATTGTDRPVGTGGARVSRDEARAPQAAVQGSGSTAAPGREGAFFYLFVGLSALLIAALAYMAFHLWRTERDVTRTLESIEREMLSTGRSVTSMRELLETNRITLAGLAERVESAAASAAMSAAAESVASDPAAADPAAAGPPGTSAETPSFSTESWAPALAALSAPDEHAQDQTRTALSASSARPKTDGVYVWTRPGDSLWSISRDVLGDGRLYTRIAEANDLPDPDKVPAGVPLFVPLADRGGEDVE